MEISCVRTFFSVLSFIWMLVIFLYSAQPAIESVETSSKYAHFVCEHILPWYDDLGVEEQEICLQNTDHIIRKIAHFAEYAILGFLVSGIFITKEIRGRKRVGLIIVSWFISTFYAATDEYHQLFVPGRSGQVSDVLIDSSGALAGVLMYWLCMKVLFTKERNVEKNLQ